MCDSKLCWVKEADKSQTSVAQASKSAVINTYTEKVAVRTGFKIIHQIWQKKQEMK